MNENNLTVVPIPLGMVNVFLIKGERPILVDTGNPGDEKKILDALSLHGIAPQDISLIFITHSHADHIGNVAALKEHTGAKVAIQQSEADALKNGNNAELNPAGAPGQFFLLFISEKTKISGVEPDILIEQEFDLKEFGVDGKVIATPGHTSGSSSMVLANGDAIIGDLIFGGFIRKALPNYPWFIADKTKLHESIKTILSYQPKIIYASHGGPFTAQIIANKFPLT